MKLYAVFLAALMVMGLPSARAADDAAVAVQSARIETLRARLATVSSPAAAATLLEADDLLRQLRAAPPSSRSAIRAQLDAALVRAELEMEDAKKAAP